MLFYFIPFLLLLVVALVLKKRDQKSVSSNEKNPKQKNLPSKPNKKSADKTRGKTNDNDQSNLASVNSTAVAPELLQKLQQLIHGGHYSTAEAQINQALNRDNNQHELYLLLLKLHLMQKDELATNQLLNYIRSLKIPSLLAEAENKRQEYEQIQSIENDYLNENLVVEKTASRSSPQSFDQFQLQHKSNQTSNADADADADHSDNTVTDTVADFDFSQFDFSSTVDSSVQSNHENVLATSSDNAVDIATTTNSTTKNSSEITLDFTLEQDSSKATQASSDLDTPLAFSLNSDAADPINLVQPIASPAVTPTNDELSFNFNFNVDQAQTETLPPQTDAIAPIELQQTSSSDDDSASNTDIEFENFSFSLADQTVAEPSTQVSQPHTALDFSLNEQTQTEHLSFNLSDSQQSSNHDLNTATVENDEQVNFALSELTADASALTFISTSNLTENLVHDDNNTKTISELSDDFLTDGMQDDELLKQFPQLKHLNRVQLDLDLAQRYIEFAATDAAYSLCASLEKLTLSSAQQQRLQDLQQQLSAKIAENTQ